MRCDSMRILSEIKIFVQAEFVGFDLYKKIKTYLESFVRKIYAESRHEVDLLDYYNRQWEHYQLSARVGHMTIF